MMKRGLVAALAVFALALVGSPAAAKSKVLTVIASDATGVTLRFELPKVTVVPVELPEGKFGRIEAPGMRGSLGIDGRPVLPTEFATIGIPPRTIASVRVIEETSRELTEVGGLELEPLGKHEFKPDGKSLSPTRSFFRDPAYYDGGRAWPVATAELGRVGGWRHQLVVPLQIQPFRVDPRTKSVRAVTTATIRVDFVREGGPGERAQSNLAPDVLPRGDDRSEALYRRGVINYEAARAFRVAPPVPTRRSMPFSLQGTGSGAGTGGVLGPVDEWTIKVDTTGVWRVTYAQLLAKGFPVGQPTADLTLTRREFAGGQIPPYVRVPVPIRVLEGATGTAGTFDGDDAVEFYGQSYTERAKPTDYRRRFSDAEVYFLAVNPPEVGARMVETSADRGLSGLPRPTSFPSYRKYEKRLYYSPVPRDTCAAYLTWTFPYGDNTFTDTLTTWTPDVDPTGTVTFSTYFVGVGQNPYQHTIWMRWKRPSDGLLTPVATRTWGGKDDMFSDTTFAADRIASGTNFLNWRGYSVIPGFPDGGYSGGSLVWYAVTYPRLYRAFQNRLDLNSGDASGDTEIEVTGFTAASAPTFTVYDVTDSTAARALVVPPSLVTDTGGGTWALRFQDQVASGTRRRYIVALATPTLPDVAIAKASRVNGVPIWDAPGQPDFLIVTPDVFRPEIERLATHRRGQGFDVLVASESEVYDAFDGGRRSDWAIKRFNEYAFARWDSRFVLLVGDASDDPRGSLAISDRNWLPARTISAPVVTGDGQELSPSDFWYVADLTDLYGESNPCTFFEPDLLPEMAIGRLPVGSVAQTTALVNKLIAYDTQDREAAWRHKALLVADDAYSYGSFFGEVTPNYCYTPSEVVFDRIHTKLESVIKNDGGFQDFNVEQFRLSEKLVPLGRLQNCVPLNPAVADARRYVSSYTRPQFLDDLAQGALIVNYQGHGSGIVLAHEALFNSFGSAQDVDFVFNEGKPFFFLSFSCHVNQFSYFQEKSFGDGLGENMLIGPQNPPRPTAGAIGSYASTNFEYLPSDQSGQTHLNVFIFEAMFVDPPSEPLHGESGARVLLGEALNLGGVNTVNSTSTFGVFRRAVQTYCLLGDPTTPLETGAPRLFATANNQPVVSGVRYQPGAEGDSVAFILDLVDESRIDDLQLSITGEGARAVDPSEYVVTPSFPDTANGGNGQRYQVIWTIRPQAKDADFNVSIQDRSGLASSFTLPLRLETRLFANNQAVNDGDTAPSTGTYQFVVNSPAQLDAGDMVLRVDGTIPAGLSVTPAPTDSSQRLWVLSWPANFETGSHDAVITFPGGATRRVSFLTSDEARVALNNVFAFPSPFANPPMTFNFTLNSDQAATVAIKIYSVSGSLVYTRVEEGVGPGYHQWIWDGTDQYGDALANGTYLYNVIAEDDRGLKDLERGKFARVR